MNTTQLHATPDSEQRADSGIVAGKTDVKVRTIPVFLLLGAALFATSFFLPAIVTSGTTTYPGWICAYLTMLIRPHWLFLCFLINPLSILYFFLKIFERLPQLRLFVAIVVLGLFVPTSLALRNYPPTLGCEMWIVSILLMMAEDLGTWKLKLLRQ